MNKHILHRFVVFFIVTVVLTAAAFNLFGLSVDSLKPAGWVNDYAGIIDAANSQKITSLIGELQEKTTAEIAVVTIPSLEQEDLTDFTNRLFAKWGIGKKGKDNGVMILIAVNERKIRIETGYGLEGAIPDSVAGAIIRDEMTPRFRNNDASGGILAGTYAVASRIAAEYNVQLTGVYEPAETQNTVKATPFQKLLSLIFMIIMVIIFIKNPWLFLLLLAGGRRGGGGGFGGGFGGFGGGSSGGGGANGGW